MQESKNLLSREQALIIADPHLVAVYLRNIMKGPMGQEGMPYKKGFRAGAASEQVLMEVRSWKFKQKPFKNHH